MNHARVLALASLTTALVASAPFAAAQSSAPAEIGRAHV